MNTLLLPVKEIQSKYNYNYRAKRSTDIFPNDPVLNFLYRILFYRPK